MPGNQGLGEWVTLNVNRFYWLLHMSETLTDWKQSGSFDKKAGSLIEDEWNVLRSLMMKLQEDCDISCGSVCCHFSSLNSVPLTRHDLMQLRASAPKTDGLYTTVPLSKLDDRMRMFLKFNPDFVFTVDGVEIACMLSTKNKKVNSKILSKKPMLVKTGGFIWADGNSKACIFLDPDGKCGMYKGGVHFWVCRNFLCGALFARAVFDWFGIKFDGRRDIGKLNLAYEKMEVAVSDFKFVEKEQRLDDAFRQLVVDALNKRKVSTAKFKRQADSYRKAVKDALSKI